MLGAGLGTRLRPLTTYRPKPLLPIFDKPLITFALDHLSSAGITSFVINTHHLADQFQKFFSRGKYNGRNVDLIHEPYLLETGGGIKNAEPLIGNHPFIVYSGDILTDINIQHLIEEHFHQGNDVTLALRETGLSSSIAVQNGRVVDVGGHYGHPGSLDFANISVWNPSIFSRIPAGKKISFVPILRDWIGAGGKIGGILLNEDRWFNIGSRNEYLDVHRTIFYDGWKPNYVAEKNWPLRVSPSARISPTAQLEGFYAIGNEVEIGDEVTVRDTIVWENAKIASRTRLEGCIIHHSLTAQGEMQNADL